MNAYKLTDYLRRRQTLIAGAVFLAYCVGFVLAVPIAKRCLDNAGAERENPYYCQPAGGTTFLYPEEHPVKLSTTKTEER